MRCENPSNRSISCSTIRTQTDAAKNRTALVFGFTGIAGNYIASHLLDAGWNVVGVTRPGRSPTKFSARRDRLSFVEADPTQQFRLSGLDTSAITHIVCSVFAAAPGEKWDVVTDLNARIFANVIECAQAQLPRLQRVLKLQGQKYYGNHLGPYRTPARESDPRHAGRNFYFDQQELLEELAPHVSWDYTILRPHILIGNSTRALMNPLMVIGAYASLCKALNRPFSFPGDPVAYDVICQATDADLLGRGSVWALETPRASNQIYNITNGDFFRWRHIWEKVAGIMGLKLSDPEPMPFMPFLDQHQDVWRNMAEKQELVQPDVFKLVDWAFGYYVFRCAWDIMASTIKIRQAGFAECRDSEEMFVTRLAELRAAKMLPTF